MFAYFSFYHTWSSLDESPEYKEEQLLHFLDINEKRHRYTGGVKSSLQLG